MSRESHPIFRPEQIPSSDHWTEYHFVYPEFRVDERFLVPFTEQELSRLIRARELQDSSTIVINAGSTVERELVATYAIPSGHVLKNRAEVFRRVRDTASFLDRALAGHNFANEQANRSIFMQIRSEITPFLPQPPKRRR